MEAPINRFARGLLSFLDLKQQGKTPRELGSIVTPEIDLTQFYLQDVLQDQGIFQAAAAIPISAGGNVNRRFTIASPDTGLTAAGGLAVPQDEIWYVDRWQVFVINGAAGDFHASALTVFSTGFGTGVRSFMDANVTVRTENGAMNITTLSRPFFAWPGSELCFTGLSFNITVATNGNGAIRFARLKI